MNKGGMRQRQERMEQQLENATECQVLSTRRVVRSNHLVLISERTFLSDKDRKTVSSALPSEVRTSEEVVRTKGFRGRT